MAIPTLPQSAGPAGQATTAEPGPGGCTIRERFNNLPESVRSSVLDKYRHWNTEHIDWWDSVYDTFKSEMEAIGLEVDRMYFSGFWSQGDGACFEGSVRNWEEFLPSLGYNCPALINHAANHFRFSAGHSGHYYHENCTRFSVDLPLPDHDEDRWFADVYLPYEKHSVQEAAAMALLNTYSSSSLESVFTDAFKDHMRELYKRLEAEYDYLTSDEAVLEALEANDQLEDAINDAITEEEEHA